MKKLIFFVLALTLMLSSSGCKENAVLDKTTVYPVESNIHSLDIRINAADFSIRYGEKFSVESNLKNLTVAEKNGVLTIVEKTKNAVTYTNAMLTLYLPADAVFGEIDIETGAAKMTAKALTAKSLELQLGAGDVSIDELNVSMEADIEGGAGQITISGGTLNNLDLEMGMGELNLTAALRGDNDLALGMGEANLTLIGGQSDYTVNVEKGIGSITVGGKDVPAFNSSGNSQNRVKIEGGVGAVNLAFVEAGSPVLLVSTPNTCINKTEHKLLCFLFLLISPRYSAC